MDHNKDNVIELDFRKSGSKPSANEEAFGRLSRSLEIMKAELKTQRDGIQKFRRDTAAIEKEVNEMGFHLERFQKNIGSTKIGSVRRRAERLGMIADSWVAAGKQAG